ncbi:MAG: hypothetical protein AAF702_51295 [Chloroflexota bacterium]
MLSEALTERLNTCFQTELSIDGTINEAFGSVLENKKRTRVARFAKMLISGRKSYPERIFLLLDHKALLSGNHHKSLRKRHSVAGNANRVMG